MWHEEDGLADVVPVMIPCIMLLKLKKSRQIFTTTRAYLKRQVMRFEKFYTDVLTELLAFNMYKDSVCTSSWPCVSLNPSKVSPSCLKCKYLYWFSKVQQCEGFM